MSGGQSFLPTEGRAIGAAGGEVDLGRWRATAQRLAEDAAFRQRVAEALAQQGLDPDLLLGAVGAALPQQRPAPAPPAVAPPRQPIGQSRLVELALQAMTAGRR